MAWINDKACCFQSIHAKRNLNRIDFRAFFEHRPENDRPQIGDDAKGLFGRTVLIATVLKDA